MKRSLLVGLGAVLGLLVTTAAWFILRGGYTYHGVLIDPPARAADFELVNQMNQPFHLSEQHGKVVMIFFGYTNCPDVCPITLNEFKQIKEQLGDRADEIEFVMVTLDPERDTVEQLHSYMNKFDAEFTGLTGDDEALQAVWKNYGVFRDRHDVEGSLEYLMDHSSRIYVIDPQGNWRLNYPFGMDARLIVQDLVQLLKES